MACTLSEFLGLVIVAFIVLTTSSRVKYFVKFIVFIIAAMFAATLPIPLMLPRPRDHRNALIPAWCIVQIGKLLGVRFELQGLEHVNTKTGGVVLINHQSALDLIVLAKLWPVIGRPTQVAKKEILYLFPFSLACWLWGTLFLDRQNHKAAVSIINNESKAINEKKSKILFFPEGTRNQSGTLLKFKKGPFHVAIDSQCSIQPVVVSRYSFLDYERKFFGEGRVVIKILPAIDTSGMSKSDVDKLMVDVRNSMQDQFVKLSDEVDADNQMKFY